MNNFGVQSDSIWIPSNNTHRCHQSLVLMMNRETLHLLPSGTVRAFRLWFCETLKYQNSLHFGDLILCGFCELLLLSSNSGFMNLSVSNFVILSFCHREYRKEFVLKWRMYFAAQCNDVEARRNFIRLRIKALLVLSTFAQQYQSV